MQTKKRKMKAGEALVGMKRSGSQLEGEEDELSATNGFVLLVKRKGIGGARGATAGVDGG